MIGEISVKFLTLSTNLVGMYICTKYTHCRAVAARVLRHLSAMPIRDFITPVRMFDTTSS